MQNNFKGGLVLSYVYFKILFWFDALNENFNLDFFSGKIVTSLADISQWKMPYSKIFSGINFFICLIADFQNSCSTF